ncbi:tetratricopeptide (TPR) repeat protein [Angulomicrobium tetraedrale]|uniref:Tetratricopeptide (TPR) repeat protein n=2 Tax=Ancylobacter tetraedralis TaxID=217068 RepID=A0A839Z6T4_9HYPH|nr:tetratricopeptide (TPR) repeat protein [Ancylobacter tetraedralis]
MTFRRLSLRPGAAILAIMTALGASPVLADAPPDNFIARSAPAGNYLAARLATAERDTPAAAAYYRALVRSFPRSGEILERAFLAVLAEGSIDEAVDYAQRIVRIDPEHTLARLVLGVRAIKSKQYVTARSNLRRSGQGAIAELNSTLLSAWSQYGSGNPRAGVAAIDELKGPEWYAGFKDFHAGLLLDAAGAKKEAGQRLESALKIDPRTLRVVDAYGRWASRSGNKKLAVDTYEAFDKLVPNDPLVDQELSLLEAGKTLPALITTPSAGAAEVLYGLGAALARQGGEDLALIYLQLGHWLDPSHPLIEITLADLFETQKRNNEAITLYRSVPSDSPFKVNADVQMALNLDAVGDFEGARKTLEAVVAKNPKDLRALMALGDVLRSNEKYADAADIYTKAIDQLQTPTAANWMLYYFRGTSYERTKQWEKSEADLKKALELKPDQPHVLNYLGYSWIDQGIHLDQGTEMIRKAVSLRPDDGFFIDSLGWAYYRTGHYDDAVRELERAVELKPNEAVINDHLGDAYWKVGRKLEATFKWNHARDLKPDADELQEIELKIAVGLDEAERRKNDKPDIQKTEVDPAAATHQAEAPKAAEPPAPVETKPDGGG